MRNIAQQSLLFLKGLAMGAADVVPGVSGGTIAFVSGIYAELLKSITSVNLQALRLLRSEGLAAAWTYINGNFLAVLLAGILTSLFSLAKVMQFLLAEHPLPLWSFFTGLIIGSVIYLLRQNPPRRKLEQLMFILGVACAYAISIAPAITLEGNHISMFFAGSIALCAMILPGISGSFILVLLGLYPVFINAIANFQLDILLVFAVGGLLGLMLFSRFLTWLLRRFHTLVIATMCGFLVGSLNVIWPWKLVTESVISQSGKVIVLASENLLPGEFSRAVGQDPLTLLCICAFGLGLVLVLGLEYIGVKHREESSGGA
jgi:putative membrane protein